MARHQGRPEPGPWDHGVMSTSPAPVRPGRVSPHRAVPDLIARPPYLATGGQPAAQPPRILRDESDIARLRRAGSAARRVLDRVTAAVGPGVTTDELDRIAHDACVAEGGYPSPLGYRGFPKAMCTSVNEVVAHGIPDDRPLADGDIVNCDVTIFLDGMHGDCSLTLCIGDVGADTRKLVEVTERALERALAVIGPDVPQRMIGHTIQALADEHGLGVVRELVGHGIGEQFHGPPWIRHYDDPTDRARLLPGMAFTVEPMLTLGRPDVVMWADGWTIVTLDGSPSAQFEHTVLVTDDGVEVLTGGDGR
jgi:methionyl aminopeptidase